MSNAFIATRLSGNSVDNNFVLYLFIFHKIAASHERKYIITWVGVNWLYKQAPSEK